MKDWCVIFVLKGKNFIFYIEWCVRDFYKYLLNEIKNYVLF